MEKLIVTPPVDRRDALVREGTEARVILALSRESGSTPDEVARILACARQILDGVIPAELLTPHDNAE